MICAVYISWFSNGNRSPTTMRCIDVKGGDIERVARTLAKSMGKLKNCSFIIESNGVEFKTDDNDTIYWVRIEPMYVEEI